MTLLTFNGQNIKCLHEAPLGPPPELHAQRNQFAGIIGVSQIILGVGGRTITIEVWLADASFTTAQAVDDYRQFLDSSIGTTADLVITGSAPAFFGDCTFSGYEPKGSVLPAYGGAPQLPNGTYWQAGRLSFFQNTPD